MHFKNNAVFDVFWPKCLTRQKKILWIILLIDSVSNYFYVPLCLLFSLLLQDVNIKIRDERN
jgi:hypothetical protein